MNGKKRSIARMVLALVCTGIMFGAGAQNNRSARIEWHSMQQADATRIGSRIYFVDFYTDWCGYCKKMDRETFSDPTVAAIMNKYYYPVKFNAESRGEVTWNGKTYRAGQNGRSKVHEFAYATLGPRMGFPTFALFRSDGALLQSVPGYYSAKDFVVILWYFASGDCDKYPFDRYQQIFDREIRPQMEKALGTAK